MKILRKLIPVLAAITIWFIASKFTNPLFIPQPQKVLETFIELSKSGLLLSSAVSSFVRITIATLLACGISIPLGLLVANYKWADAIVSPITNLTRFIPVTAFYPLLIMWLGIGEQMKITFLFIATFLYFLPAVILSIKDTNHDLIDTALTMGMSKLQVMCKVMLPHALPVILQNFITMYGIGWTYSIVVEVINTQHGLGHLMHIGSARGRTDLVFVSIITILIISYAFDTIGNKLIRKAFKWKFTQEL